jgi:hypothetical protein
MDARELYKAEEVLDAVFPSRNEAAEIVHPGKEPFYFPASAIATQLASILALASATAVGRDQFDAVLAGELFIEWVRVIGFVANEPGRAFATSLVGSRSPPLTTSFGISVFDMSRGTHPPTLPMSSRMHHFPNRRPPDHRIAVRPTHSRFFRMSGRCVRYFTRGLG